MKQHKPVQSLVFEKEMLFQWLAAGPSEGEALRDKLVALVCYYGMCRIADIVHLSFDNVHVREKDVVVEIARSKSAASEACTQFIIPSSDGVDPVALFNAYISTQCDNFGRFWRHIRRGRWTTFPVGHNVLAATPSRIASTLKLPDPPTLHRTLFQTHQRDRPCKCRSIVGGA